MSTTTKTHTTPDALLLAISAAHGTTDAARVARVVAVHDAIKAGSDVKTLAAELATKSATSGKYRAVGQTVLGFAKAVGTVADKLGVSVETMAADVATTSAVYQAIERHGVTTATREVVEAGLGGKSTSAKLARARKRAAAMVDEAKAARKAAAKSPKTPAPGREDSGEETSGEGDVPVKAGGDKYAAQVRALSGAIVAGRVPVTADLLAAIAALTEAARVATPRTTATPAKVAQVAKR